MEEQKNQENLEDEENREDQEDQKNQDNQNNQNNRSDFQDIVLAFIGAYLIYLAYQLIAGNAEEGVGAIGWILAAVVFAVVGILVIIRTVVRLYRNHKS